jgi:pyruvate/2-oxoglutarate dehydrogenase complex dihydrolipoamide dehydrogenase (E3) component
VCVCVSVCVSVCVNLIALIDAYVRFQLAGVLNGFGNEVVVMQRNSTYLRGFDRGMVKHITADMARHGVKFATDTVASVENLGSGDIHGTDKRLRVKYTSGHTEEFETVVECIGRLPASAEVFAKMRTADGESALSINTDGYCEVDEHHTTNIQSVHVIGDLAADSLKLTPAAIVAGRFLAERLFSGGTRVLRNEDVPVTVFTPLEYGFVGLSEEEAVEKYGRGGIDVHHARFQPLQWQLNFAREEASCYAKYIVVPGEGDRYVCTCVRCMHLFSFSIFSFSSFNAILFMCTHTHTHTSRVVGIHFAGPHAGEVLQGFAVAFTSGITKEHMLNAVGIHPTTAEELVSITATYSNGEDPKKTSC